VTVAVRDGPEWVPGNERQMELDDPVHVGLVVCSFRPKKRCEAVFEDVTVRRLPGYDA
jgi:hypothetical protein